MIAAYIRVSSKGQDYKMQRHSIEQAAKVRGIIIEEWYAEKRTATKKAPRPELDRLLQDVIAGKVRTCVVFKLDRLTRLGISDTLDTIKSFREAGCTVHFASDGIPSIEPGETNAIRVAMQEMLLSILAVAAQIEGLARSERVSAARERMELEGIPWGRPLNERTINAENTVIMLSADGLTHREIAQRVKIPRSTVGRILARLTRKATTLPDGPAGVQDTVSTTQPN